MDVANRPPPVPPPASSIGVLLIGHGTRDERGTGEFFQLAGHVEQRLDGQPLVACLLEFQQPSIADGWKSLTERGVNHVRVAPLLLFAAGHAKQDIPNAIARCQETTPWVQHDQCGPISRHPAIIELLGRRLQTTLGMVDTAARRTAVVIVGRGSYDPCAQADMRVLGELINHRLHVSRVETAFFAMANPKLPEVIDGIASGGDCDAVVVQPHLLFSGRLLEAIGRQCEEAEARHPGLRVVCSGCLGPEPLVAAAIADRISSVGRGQCR